MKVGACVSKKKAKKSFLKPAIGAVAALAVIGAFVPSEESPSVDDTTPPAIVEEVKQPEKRPVENLVEDVQEPKEPVKEEVIQQAEPQKETPVEKQPELPVVEIDPEQAFREKLNQYNYVGSSESNKYHEPSCHWTKEINDSNLVHFDTEEEAAAAGYIPCGTCKP